MQVQHLYPWFNTVILQHIEILFTTKVISYFITISTSAPNLPAATACLHPCLRYTYKIYACNGFARSGNAQRLQLNLYLNSRDTNTFHNTILSINSFTKLLHLRFYYFYMRVNNLITTDQLRPVLLKVVPLVYSPLVSTKIFSFCISRILSLNTEQTARGS